MKLSELIEQATSAYGLRLDNTTRRDLYNRLVAANVPRTIPESQTSVALDTILTTYDAMKKHCVTAAASYSDMKREAVAGLDGCPRCHQPMKRVELVGARAADYCRSCAITLPTRV